MFQVGSNMPQGDCYNWQADVLWLNVMGDGAIALSCLAIPIALLVYIQKYQKLDGLGLKVLTLFSLFIFLTGLGHLASIWTVWNPDYYVSGFFKLLGGITSLSAAIYFCLNLRRLGNEPSVSDIEAINVDLARIVSEKEGDLEDKNEQLEQYAVRLKRKRDLLNNYECEFRQAIESAPNAMLMISINRKIAFANKAASDLIGQSIVDLVGATLDQFVALESLEQVETKITEIFAGKKEVDQDEMSISHSGTNELKVAIKMTKHQSLDETCVVISALDLTERAKLIHSLEEKNTELVRSNEDLDDFAYISSHDLKSPLRAIRNLAQWVTEDCAGILPSGSSDDLKRLIQRAKEAESMLAGLHSYAKFSRMDSQIKTVTVADVVTKTAGIIDKPENFKIIGPNVDFSFEARSTPFETVIRNLVSNSIKHRVDDDGQVEVNWHVNKEWLTIEVSDNGKGIAESQHEKIFRMYNTADEKKDGNASGIGLAIVKKAVEREGGNIRVHNNQNCEGVSFVFTWPVKPQIRN